MKTDSTGGDAEHNVTQRLARLYDVELGRAERDFPTMRLAALGGADRAPRPRMKLRLLTEAVAIVAVGAIVVAGGWLATNPQTPSGPAPGGIALGSDGIPNQIDGQRVYRVGEQADWEKLSGSFLLGAYAVRYTPPCPPRSEPTLPPAETALIARCTDQGFPQMILMARPGDPYASSSTPLFPAAKGADALEGWVDGPAVVMRVHTHDGAATGCQPDQVADCQAAVVVEDVVWPAIPTQISGEKVHRAADQASFAGISGSFLLGGPFSKPDFVPPCPMQMNQTAAEQQLLPYCFVQTIDGLQLSPNSTIDQPRDELVVARVHVNDPLAADCPATTQAECKASIVVESVVWSSSELVAAASPSTVPSAVSTTNPTASQTIGSGVPTQIDGKRVYPVADESEWQKLSGSFLLAGTPYLVAPSCFVAQASGPTGGAADRDLLQGSCGTMRVGQTMGSAAMLAPRPGALVEPWDGSPIVVRVHTHDAEAASCAADNKAKCDASLVVEAVVWPVVPAEINGEKVYRATDEASFATLTGSFLLGGRFTKPDFFPSCPVPTNDTAAEQRLLPYCYVRTIDGLQLSTNSSIDESNNEIVVVRAHVNDPLAADCPPATQAQCKAAIVVESVVWRSDTLINAMPSGFAGPIPSGTPTVVAPPPPAITPPSIGTPLPSAP
jgi:hypothetical protein